MGYGRNRYGRVILGYRRLNASSGACQAASAAFRTFSRTKQTRNTQDKDEYGIQRDYGTSKAEIVRKEWFLC